MSHEAIGTSSRSEGPLSQGEGVAFNVPYGEGSYDITLTNPEMDLLLQAGFQELLGNHALSGFDYTVQLQQPDLPLYIGARSIRTEPNSSGYHDTSVGVSVVTQSVVYEHRGILLAKRLGHNGAWSFVDYNAQPPLKEPEPDLFYLEV